VILTPQPILSRSAWLVIAAGAVLTTTILVVGQPQSIRDLSKRAQKTTIEQGVQLRTTLSLSL